MRKKSTVLSIIYLLTFIFISPVYTEEMIKTEQPDFSLAEVRILPGRKGSVKGFRILGSITGSEERFVLLADCPYKEQGKDGWVTVSIKNPEPYRWLRIEGYRMGISPIVAEVEFISPSGKMSGSSYGTETEDTENAWEKAFDGDPKTLCSSLRIPGHISLDLGPASQAALQIKPASGVYKETLDIIIDRTPADAVVHYTLDGSIPTRDHGILYEKLIRFEKSGAIAAIAFKKDIASTLVMNRAYSITTELEVRSCHLGDSFAKDGAVGLPSACWSAGRNVQSIQGEGNDKAVLQMPDRGVDQLFVQSDLQNAEQLINTAREQNPSVQPWLFAGWPGESEWKQNLFNESLNPNPKNWEEALYLKMSGYRSLLEKWNLNIKDGNKVQLCPAGSALLNLKNEIATDLVPGMKDLFDAVFHDDLDLNSKGEYLLACVQYACMFGESPEEKTNSAGTGLTLEQARIFERIAWETVISEPDSGHAEGKALWFPASGRSHETAPFEFYSPAMSISVTHSHSDDKPSVPYASGMLINRHVWPNRFIKEYEPITRNSPGRDEKPWGTCLPLALFPRIQGNGWGGELLKEVEKNDGRTLHQVQWDYLQEHVDRAYDYYIRQRQDIWPDDINDLESRPDLADKELTPEYFEGARRGLTEYEKFIAIANYASAWQCRTKKGGARCSVHGVDVLHYGHHCGGTSKIFMQMFTVAGLKVRMLGWNCHMSNEVKVGKKWIFADMIIRNGAQYRSTHSWAELTSDPEVYPTAVLSYMRSPTARGTNYVFAPAMYWHGVGGIEQYDKAMGHKTSSLQMEYLPNVASALYPSMRLHIWHITKGADPELKLCGGGSSGQTVSLKPGMAVRKRFWLSACQDNPIIAGKASFRLKGGGDSLICTLDGKQLKERSSNVFQLPVELLTPGEHELILQNAGAEESALSFYPDMVRPYLYPVNAGPVEIRPVPETEGTDEADPASTGIHN